MDILCCGAELTDDELGRAVAKDCQCPNKYLDEEWLDDRIGC